jgi:hypothetical protein
VRRLRLATDRKSKLVQLYARSHLGQTSDLTSKIWGKGGARQAANAPAAAVQTPHCGLSFLQRRGLKRLLCTDLAATTISATWSGNGKASSMPTMAFSSRLNDF